MQAAKRLPQKGPIVLTQNSGDPRILMCFRYDFFRANEALETDLVLWNDQDDGRYVDVVTPISFCRRNTI